MTDSFTENLLALLVRSFIPITPFYTNFLVETKGFTNKEVSTSITPYYFFSSLIAVFACKTILHTLGLEYTSICIALLYFLNMIFLLNAKKRSFWSVRIVYLVTGFIVTLDMIYRFYIGETNKKGSGSDVKSSYVDLYRTLVSSLACCVGQEIVRRTGFYEINIHLSIFAQFIGLIMAVKIGLREKKVELIDIGLWNAVKSMDSSMWCAFGAGAITSCYLIFTKLFINSIHREKDTPEESKPSQSDIIIDKMIPEEAMRIPIKILATVLMWPVTVLFPKYKSNGKAQKKFLNGNMDAVVNIVCCAMIYSITLVLDSEYKKYLYVFSLIASSAGLLFMTRVKHRAGLYFMYLCTTVFSRACSKITKKFLTNKVIGNSLVIVSVISETLLHVFVNQAFKGITAVQKTMIYACIGVGIFAMIMTVKILGV